MKRPIAMKCTQEQFDSIKDRIPLDIYFITSFEEDNYLVNNYKGYFSVSNCFSPSYDEIHETFNADIFLEACGVEKNWKGSEMQFKEKDGKWINCTLENYIFRFKPAPDYTAEIAELENKIKELKAKML